MFTGCAARTPPWYEDYFVSAAALPRLRFACCGWEHPRCGRLEEGGREYSLYMLSEESLVSERGEWLLIPWFYVWVEYFLEEP